MHMMNVDAFAVPRPLRLRKRKNADTSTAYFTEDEYHLFSVQGDSHESRLYGDEEARRHVVVTRDYKVPPPPKPSSERAAAAASLLETIHSSLRDVKQVHNAAPAQPVVVGAPPLPQRHLLDILYDRKHKADADSAENISRRISTLTIAQHVQYLKLLQKRVTAQLRGLPALLALSNQEAQEWTDLDSLVELEQAALRADLERLARKDCAARYTFVPTFAHHWHEKTMVHCKNDVYRMYSQHYEPCVAIPYATDPRAKLPPRPPLVMQHVKEVMHYGSAFVVDEETLFAPGMTLNRDPVITANTSTGEDASSSTTAATTAAAIDEHYALRECISTDSYAEQLMDTHDCEFAISSSTLLTLFDNDTKRFESNYGWIIPVKSRLSMLKDGSTKKRVYLDRSLPSRYVPARQKLSEASTRKLLTAFKRRSGKPTDNGRRSYHVWQLGDHRVLVRTTTHAMITETTAAKGGASARTARKGDAGNTTKTSPLSLFVKVDHEDLSLPESLSPSERNMFWLHSWLRGNSTVVIGRLNPLTTEVISWEKHSLSTLVLGSDPNGSLWIEPRERFHLVRDVLVNLLTLPTGNYVVRHGGVASKTAEILMSTAKPANDSAAADSVTSDNNGLFDLHRHIAHSGETSSEIVDYSFPTWPHTLNRVPYTYRTGTYCRDFLLDGVCPLLAANEYCGAVHLRQSTTSPWLFEDYTLLLQKMKKTEFALPPNSQPFFLEPDFPLCRNSKSMDPTDPHAPVRCQDPKCQLPHMTVHEVAERLADLLMREMRFRRRKHKQNNRVARGRKQPNPAQAETTTPGQPPPAIRRVQPGHRQLRRR